ncbi:RNA 2',3'-cyclic phosphodiesterase [bacterium]|nr:MAG: RNA 2',3'-cyclic phosphodiesterase [bacterium]
MRLFIAIDLPFEAKKEIVGVRELIKNKGGIKWVEMENIHLTLKFLGEVEEDKVSAIEKRLKAVAKDTEPFIISLRDVGGFPTERESRVIWVGVEQGREMVYELNRKIERAMEKLGFERDSRFHPHITIGRVKRGRVNVQGLKFHYPSIFVKSFFLISSRLTPSGPIYTPLREFKLGEG